MKNLYDLFCGFTIGVANIIPGVSGGTFALLLGMYARLLGFLNRIGPAEIKNLISIIKTKDLNKIKNYLHTADYFFISKIGVGAILAILSLSALMKWLLQNQFSLTYAFFFGLITASVLIPLRLVGKWNLSAILSLVLGVVLTVGVAASVNPADKTLKKSVIYQKRYETQQTATSPITEQAFAWVGKYSTSEYVMIFSAGIIAISAMVLPGISGSLILILMGQYFMVVSALAGLKNLLLDDIVFLGVMGIGILGGLLGFARLFEFALNRWRNGVVSFLSGLVIGSLYALWPFKAYEITDLYRKGKAGIEFASQVKLYSNINIWPVNLNETLITLIPFIAGLLIMIPFLNKEGAEDSI